MLFCMFREAVRWPSVEFFFFLIKSETNSFYSSSDTWGISHEGVIVQQFQHNATIWRTEGSVTGSLPQQRQTPIHICIEVVI